MKKMKMNNKGFSLVELIIVIAIMAILAGALAPALIKYIASSRRSADVNNANTIATAINAALQDESAFDAAPTGSSVVQMPTSASGAFWTVVDENCSGGLAGVNGVNKIKSKKTKSGSTITGTVFSYSLNTANSELKIYVTGSGASYEVYPNVASEMK